MLHTFVNKFFGQYELQVWHFSGSTGLHIWISPDFCGISRLEIKKVIISAAWGNENWSRPDTDLCSLEIAFTESRSRHWCSSFNISSCSDSPGSSGWVSIPRPPLYSLSTTASVSMICTCQHMSNDVYLCGYDAVSSFGGSLSITKEPKISNAGM